MKIAVIAAIALTAQAVRVTEKQKDEPYWWDDHRIILQATPNDPRWHTFAVTNKGEATHQGIQGVNGIDKNSKDHFHVGHLVNKATTLQIGEHESPKTEEVE